MDGISREPTLASSIGPPQYPLLALDPGRARFAVASSHAIDVVTLDATSLPR